jgi:hypothetical protein
VVQCAQTYVFATYTVRCNNESAAKYYDGSQNKDWAIHRYFWSSRSPAVQRRFEAGLRGIVAHPPGPWFAVVLEKSIWSGRSSFGEPHDIGCHIVENDFTLRRHNVN